MTQFPSSNDPSMPAMPNFGGPTDFLPEPKTWPKTVGIISIVWGSLGLICNGCGLVGGLVSGPMMQQMAAQNPQLAQQMQNAPPPSGLQMGIAALGILVSTMLIVAGSMLIARKPIAAALHLAWAVITLLLTIGNTIVSIGPMQQQMQQMQTQMQSQSGAATPPPGAMQGMQAAMYGSLACMALITLSYPIFCLIWFGFVKRGTAEITHAPEAPAA